MSMRGYFGVGVEGISKELNVGNLARSAHSFGASFFFTIAPEVDMHAMRQADTSGSFDHVPYYQYESVEKMDLPMKCQLVGIEFVDEAVDLPSFRHPVRAAYVLGPEMGSLSAPMVDQCDFLVKIPMKFCINVGVAGALVMYDRMLTMGRYAPRPVGPGGPIEELVKMPRGHRRKIRTPKNGA